MKKIILPICLFAIFGNSAYSKDVESNHSYRNLGFTQAPTVSIGGSIDVLGALPKQDGTRTTGDGTSADPFKDEDTYSQEKLGGTLNNRATDDISIAGDATLLFTLNGINDYGFKYGALMELNANSTYASWNDNLNSNRAYIYGELLLGKFEIGAEQGASQKMKVDAATFARGAGGINGKYLNFINLPSVVTSTGALSASSPLFILIPELPTAHGGYAMGFNNLSYTCDINGDGTVDITTAGQEKECFEKYGNDNYRLRFQEMQTAMKVSYYTPEIYGFQAGVSYTPDTGNRGTSGFLTSKLNTGDIDDVLEYGLSYSDTFEGLSVALSYTGQVGKSESKKLDSVTGKYKSFRKDLNASQYGANISFFGLTFGGSMGNWNDSLFYTTEATKGKGTYSTLGMAYEFGPVNASVGYMQSEFQDNQYKAYSIDFDYKVAKGFLPYVEFTSFDFKPKDSSIVKNKGYVILSGFLLNF